MSDPIVYSNPVIRQRFPKPPCFAPEPVFGPGMHWTEGTPRCPAWCPNKGRQCKHPPCVGREHCQTHGGTQPLGVANVNFKTGRYSQSLPSHLASRYEELLRDKNYLALRDSMALNRAHILELTSSLKEGGVGDWQTALSTWADVLKAQRSGDGDRLKTALNEHAEAMGAFGRHVATWREIDRGMDTERKQAETEVKTLQAAQQFITVEQVLAQNAALLSILGREITDRLLLVRVVREMERVLRA